MAAATQEVDGLSRDSTAGDALPMLEQALRILDDLHKERPDLGARLHELIEALRETG